MEAIYEAETDAYSAASLTPRERMQMMKENLMKDEAKERNKPWEQSRITRKNSHLSVNVPSTYRDRPPPPSGILRRTSAASTTGSDYSLSPCPSPYSQCSDFAPPLERRSSKVRFSFDTTDNSPASSLNSIKRPSSIEALRADLERAKASLTGAIRATMDELAEVEFGLRRLSAEELDAAFQPQPLRMPRLNRAPSAISTSSYASLQSDSSEISPSRPPKSPLRHSISTGSSISAGPTRSVSVSTLGSDSSFSTGAPRNLSVSTTSSSYSYDLPVGPSYNSLLPQADQRAPSPCLTPRTPTLNRSGWSGDAEISPRSTPQPEVPVAVLPDPPVEASPASSTRSRSSSIWSLTGLDFPVPPERVYVFPKFPSVTTQGPSPLGQSADVEQTASASTSPAFPVLELVEELERRMSIKSVQAQPTTLDAEAARAPEEPEQAEELPSLDAQEDPAELSPEESPVITPIRPSPISASRSGEVDIYAVPLSFTTLKREDPLSMTLLEAAVDCEIVSPNSSLLKAKSKVPSRRITVNLDEDDDGWMGSDAEEEEYFSAMRRLASQPTRRPSVGNSAASRLSQLSNSSLSSASTMEILTPAPSSSELPSHSQLPSRLSTDKNSPGAHPWGRSSPNASPTSKSQATLPAARMSTSFQFQKMPRPALADIEWGPPEVLYDAMDWVWRPQSDSPLSSPSGSPRITPRGSRCRPMVDEDDEEDLRKITFDEVTPRPTVFDRVPSPPLRMPDGVVEWLLSEDMSGLEHEVGMAY